MFQTKVLNLPRLWTSQRVISRWLSGNVEITSTMVKNLRAITNAPILDCKNALRDPEVNGDQTLAIEWLRKKGVQVAAKKQDRATNEGLIGAIAAFYPHSNVRSAVTLAELRSETDFVARNESFQKLLQDILSTNLTLKTDNLDTMLHSNLENSEEKVKDAVIRLTAAVGEKVALQRVTYLNAETSNTIFGMYLHQKMNDITGAKAGIVSLDVHAKKHEAQLDESKLSSIQQLADSIALQLVGGSPMFISKLSPQFIEKEKEIETESARTEMQEKGGNVEAEVLAKRVEKKVAKKLGQLEKEIILEKQTLITGKLSIAQLIQATERETGTSIKIARACRYELGNDNTWLD